MPLIETAIHIGEVRRALPDAAVVPFWSVADRGGPAAGRASPVERKRILIVEDEFLLADEIAEWLSSRGAYTIGPAGSVAAAGNLIRREERIDAAILDINLSGVLIFDVALDLDRRGVPFLFASAYTDDVEYPAELKDNPRLAKPFGEAQLIDAVERLFGARGGPQAAGA